jgi:hypothetical protein
MDMSADRCRRWAASSGGADPSDPTTWYAWAHRGHRLWAAMADAFWVYVYKVQRCPQVGNHDWTACPYAHKGERARRRDPRNFSYLAVTCPAFRESQQQQHLARTGAAPSCVRGLRCRYAHGVFELWLHPARFRTVMCEGGLRCPRRVCFFAHFPAELRGENDPVPLDGLPPLPPRVPRAPPSPAAPLSFPRRVDLAMQAMPGKVRLYGGAAGESQSPSAPAAAAEPVAAPVPALPPPPASPDDKEEPAVQNSRRASEDGSEDGDYPHFDLIKDMVL